MQPGVVDFSQLKGFEIQEDYPLDKITAYPVPGTANRSFNSDSDTGYGRNNKEIQPAGY